MANVYYSDRLVQVDEDKDSREYSDDAQMKTGNRNGDDSQFDESSQAEAEEGSKESTEEGSIDDAQSSTDSNEEDYDKEVKQKKAKIHDSQESVYSGSIQIYGDEEKSKEKKESKEEEEEEFWYMDWSKILLYVGIFVVMVVIGVVVVRGTCGQESPVKSLQEDDKNSKDANVSMHVEVEKNETVKPKDSNDDPSNNDEKKNKGKNSNPTNTKNTEPSKKRNNTDPEIQSKNKKIIPQAADNNSTNKEKEINQQNFNEQNIENKKSSTSSSNHEETESENNKGTDKHLKSEYNADDIKKLNLGNDKDKDEDKIKYSSKNPNTEEFIKGDKVSVQIGKQERFNVTIMDVKKNTHSYAVKFPLRPDVHNYTEFTDITITEFNTWDPQKVKDTHCCSKLSKFICFVSIIGCWILMFLILFDVPLFPRIWTRENGGTGANKALLMSCCGGLMILSAIIYFVIQHFYP